MLPYLFKLSVSLTLLFLFYRVVLRPLTFYRWNRFYLLLYSLFSLFMPFINLTPWITEDSKKTELVSIIPSITDVDALQHLRVQHDGFFSVALLRSPIAWVSFIFCAGAVFVLIKTLMQYLSLTRIRKTAVLRHEADGVKMFETSVAVSPFSFGSAVYFNSTLHSEDELRHIISHEFVHVKQKHSIDIFVGELICIVNWYNPFAWLIRHAIRQNLEFIADNEVLGTGIDKKKYQYLLLKAIGISSYSIATNFNFSSLKKRIVMMNKMKTARLHLGKFLFVLPVLAVLLLAFRSNIVHHQPPPAAPTTTNPVLAQDTVPAHKQVVIDANADREIVINIDQPDSGKKNNTATVKLKNGKTEVYHLNDPAEKAAYEKKYGRLTLPPPPPPTPAMAVHPTTKPVVVPDPALPDNVHEIHVDVNRKSGESRAVHTATVRLKNGKTEKYNLDDPAERSAYHEKYGQLPQVAPPEPLEPPQMSMDVNGAAPARTPGMPPPPPPGAPAVARPMPAGRVDINSSAEHPVLYVLDGLMQASDYNISNISPDSIAAINVLKGDNAIEKYGQKGENGVVEISTKTAVRADRLKVSLKDVLILLDGNELPLNTDLNTYINASDIKTMNVLKPSEATLLYGDKGRKGAIEITSKMHASK